MTQKESSIDMENSGNQPNNDTVVTEVPDATDNLNATGEVNT